MGTIRQNGSGWIDHLRDIGNKMVAQNGGENSTSSVIFKSANFIESYTRPKDSSIIAGRYVLEDIMLFRREEDHLWEANVYCKDNGTLWMLKLLARSPEEACHIGMKAFFKYREWGHYGKVVEEGVR